ncbi:N-acetylglucosamine kinase [Cytobacillus praedii]|uniref:N-acetylglucosamine kinase n=1 Tax=Cytobacillus praedii TaxID=1742358 RepID=UPI003F7E814A
MNDQSFHLLAVDGGGTKTLAVITDSTGSILGEGRAGASNYQVIGKEMAIKALVASIQGALAEAAALNGGPVRFEKTVFALAGIDTSNDELEVQEMVEESIKQLGLATHMLLVENDCLSALLGATQNKAGALLISGTGSIVFAHDGRGNFFRTGGWGYRVGDEGSGYWIGKEAIRSIMKMNDGREKETILSQLILQKFGFQKIEDLYNWVYSPAYCVDDVGALTALVEEAYKLGDKVSQGILDEAAAELTLLLETTIEKAGIAKEEFQLILQGGVIQNNHYIRDRVLDSLKTSAERVKVLDTDQKPITFIIKRGLNL